MGFPGGAVVKNPANARDAGSVPGSGKSSWRRQWQTTPVFLPGKSHGQRSLAGYSPWDGKDLDMTEATEHARTFTLQGSFLRSFA